MRKNDINRNLYVSKPDSEILRLQREVIRMKIEDPVDTIRRGLTTLEEACWDADWNSAYNWFTKLQGELDVLGTSLAEMKHDATGC